MAITLHQLPDRQLAPLLAAYQSVVAARRWRLLGGALGFLAACGFAAWWVKFDVFLVVGRLDVFTSYFARLARLDSGAYVVTDIPDWFWGFFPWLRLLGETLLIAYLGTVLGAFGGFCLCFLAASNLSGQRTRWAARRLLEFFRTVPEIVFALIFVLAFGLGPMAGVLALTIHTMGALGKLFTEIVENIDMKPIEGIASTGGSWFDSIRYAVLPQVMSGFATYALLRFEINFRGSSIMGFVGAGGIGHELLTAVRKFYYSDVSAILLMIIVTVFILDMLTAQLLKRLGPAGGHV